MKGTPLNIFKGKITRIIPRPTGADLIIEYAPGLQLVSRLTASSLAALNPKPGQAACAVIPALDVIVAPD